MFMALKQKFAFLIVFAASCFSCFCFDFGSGQNPFDVSALIIHQEDVYVTSQNIACSENGIEISYALSNATGHTLYAPATIKCIPLGFQTTANEIPFPVGFKILINETNIDFDGNEKDNEIHFNIPMPSEEKTVVKVSYKNLQSVGANQTGTNFKYLIKLQKNKNNEPIDYDFSYTASKNAEAYIQNIIIFDSDDDTYPELDYQIKRVFDDNNFWTFNITHHAFESDSMYIFVGLTYYDLLSDSTDIRMYRYKDMATLYVNDKDLKNEAIEMKDVFFLSNEQLRLLRNAFYAIHGYRFKSQALQNYFTQCGRYKPNSSFFEADFNETERKNIELIRQMENMTEPLLLSDCAE